MSIKFGYNSIINSRTLFLFRAFGPSLFFLTKTSALKLVTLAHLKPLYISHFKSTYFFDILTQVKDIYTQIHYNNLSKNTAFSRI